jgi:hypothetical protein
VLVNYQTDWYQSSRPALLDFCCEQKQDLGFTFTAAINPGGSLADKYIQTYIPCNMVMDDDMVIRYKVEDYDPPSLHSIVQQLISE